MDVENFGHLQEDSYVDVKGFGVLLKNDSFAGRSFAS